MDKKPDSKSPAATDAGMTSDSLAPKAMSLPAYSPVGGQVPRVAVPMPHTGPGGVLAVPSAARHDGLGLENHWPIHHLSVNLDGSR